MISAIPSIERRPPSHRLTDSLGRSQDHPASDPIGALRRHRIAYIRMMYFFFFEAPSYLLPPRRASDKISRYPSIPRSTWGPRGFFLPILNRSRLHDLGQLDGPTDRRFDTTHFLDLEPITP